MNCNKCGIGQMALKSGRNGQFMACDQYPQCKNTENVAPGTPIIPQATAPAKEYHLSPEEVNARALEAAINCSDMEQRQQTNQLLDLANVFVKYIMGNGY